MLAVGTNAANINIAVAIHLAQIQGELRADTQPPALFLPAVGQASDAMGISVAETELLRDFSFLPFDAAPGFLRFGAAPVRATTGLEELIGELRKWSLFKANWDGEGAAQPNDASIRNAVQFARLLHKSHDLPSAMLLASGNAGLYWGRDGVHADLEFLPDGRIAYFMKKNEDRHKGVLAFRGEAMPPVFASLLDI